MPEMASLAVKENRWSPQELWWKHITTGIIRDECAPLTLDDKLDEWRWAAFRRSSEWSAMKMKSLWDEPRKVMERMSDEGNIPYMYHGVLHGVYTYLFCQGSSSENWQYAVACPSHLQVENFNYPTESPDMLINTLPRKRESWKCCAQQKADLKVARRNVLMRLICRKWGHLASKCSSEPLAYNLQWFISQDCEALQFEDISNSPQRLCQRCIKIDVLAWLREDPPIQRDRDLGERLDDPRLFRDLGKVDQLCYETTAVCVAVFLGWSLTLTPFHKKSDL